MSSLLVDCHTAAKTWKKDEKNHNKSETIRIQIKYETISLLNDHRVIGTR